MGVDFYRIELKKALAIPPAYMLVADVPGTDTNYFHAEKPFIQENNCYRVTAFKKYANQVQSVSNEACIGMGAIINIPNVFTPIMT